MLGQRLVTGAVLIASLLGLVWLETWVAEASGFGGLVLLGVFAMVIVPLAAREAATLLRACSLRTPTLAAVVLSIWMIGVSFGAVTIEARDAAVALALLGPVVALFAAFLIAAWGRCIETAWTSACGLLGIAVWTGLAGSFWLLAAHDHSAWLVAGLVLVTKMGDIGAYFTGMLIGRHKLIPWLSPGKTIEGLVGGIVFGAIGGFVLSMISRGASPENELIPLAGILGGVALTVAGAAGDLMESLLKRAAEAKDSGRLLPGMGGILDVLDSPLAAGPVAFLVLFLGTTV